MLTVTVVASPVAWEHHHAMLLPVFAAALTVVAAMPRPACPALALAMAFVLSGQYFLWTKLLADGPWNPLQSYIMAGGLILAGLLLYLREVQPTESPQPSHPAPASPSVS